MLFLTYRELQAFLISQSANPPCISTELIQWKIDFTIHISTNNNSYRQKNNEDRSAPGIIKKTEKNEKKIKILKRQFRH